MRFTTKALAIAACAITIGGIAAAGTGTADAATPSCGKSCIDVFSRNFGTFGHPGFILDTFKRGQAAGTPVILFTASNSDPAEDFTVSDQGTIADFYAAGLVSSAFALRYGCTTPAFPRCTAGKDLFGFEEEYAPYGADSGLCAGLASTAVANEPVTLQPCGVSARTVCAVDTLDSCLSNRILHSTLPLINGSDTNFSHPFVLTYPGGSVPTDKPRPQLFVSNLTGFSQAGLSCSGTGSIAGIEDTQLWAAEIGQVF